MKKSETLNWDSVLRDMDAEKTPPRWTPDADRFIREARTRGIPYPRIAALIEQHLGLKYRPGTIRDRAVSVLGLQ